MKMQVLGDADGLFEFRPEPAGSAYGHPPQGGSASPKAREEACVHHDQALAMLDHPGRGGTDE